MKFRKWIATALALCMMLPTAAMAIDVETEPYRSDNDITEINGSYQINPFGNGIMTADLTAPEAQIAETYYDNVDDAAAYMLTQMKQCNELFVIGMDAETYAELKIKGKEWGIHQDNALWEISRAHNPDDPTGGDYVGNMFERWRSTDAYDQDGNASVTFAFEYRTSVEEEKLVDEKVEELVETWEAMELDEYETIKTIYDYITANVVYDYDGLADGDRQVYTAYKGLIKGTAVCMGISLLFYRLALEMGVDARYINSIDEENHAWNIVQLGDYYYNIDATWDLDENNSNEHWFLKNMADFQVNYNGSACHTRNEKYLTDAFMAAYPMAETSYVVLVDPIEGTLEELEWVYDTVTKTLVIKGEGAIPTIEWDEKYPWDEYRNEIEHVVIEEGITEIPDGILNKIYRMTTLALPSTLTNVYVDSLQWSGYNLRSITVTSGGTYYSKDGVLFSNEDGYCSLLLYPKMKTDTYYAVPDGVQNIVGNAFYSVDYLQEIFVPKTMEQIHTGAFSFCDKLKTIAVDTENKYYAAEDGILYSKDMTVLYMYPDAKTETTFTVPDTVTEMTYTMFTTSRNLKELNIPASVEIIEDASSISSLCIIEEINVSEDNPNYCSVDGVLYSKDMTVLYQYPNNKPGTEYTVPDSVKTIQWTALRYLKNLETLYMGENIDTEENAGRIIGGSDNITSVYFPGDLPDWFAMAFFNMADQVTFYYPVGATGWASPTMELGGVTYKTATYTRTTAGDLTGDGTIDVADLSLLQDYFSGNTADFDPTKADYNGDGVFTRADVMYLARALADWEGYKIS